jgi:hypothetical protein
MQRNEIAYPHMNGKHQIERLCFHFIVPFDMVDSNGSLGAGQCTIARCIPSRRDGHTASQWNAALPQGTGPDQPKSAKQQKPPVVPFKTSKLRTRKHSKNKIMYRFIQGLSPR